MDIVTLNETDYTITLAVGLTNSKEHFDTVIERLNKEKDSNLALFNSVKQKIDTTLNEDVSKLTTLYHYGNLADFTGHARVCEPYRISRDRKTYYFRDYCKTLEKQNEIDWLVNTCPDAKTAYKTVLIVIRKKYGIIATFSKYKL